MRGRVVHVEIPFDDGGPTEKGFVNGGMRRREGPIEGRALTRIEAAGGQVLLGKQEVGGMGWTAYSKDVERNAVGIWQDA